MTDCPTAEPKFTGKKMLATMLSFYAVIITVNMVMVYFALNSWTGLLTDHSYKENQVFDKKTAALEKMQNLGVRVSAAYQADHIIIEARDKAGAQLNVEQINLTIGRVIHENDDQVLVIKQTDAGIYKHKHQLAAGRWQFKVQLQLETGEVWQKTYLIEVDAK